MKYPVFIEEDYQFPSFYRINRTFNLLQVDVVPKLIRSLGNALSDGEIKPGDTVAIGVGSRGIANLAEIVSTVVDQLKKHGAVPFIIPAMGSHGGATANGQKALLESLGVSESSCGCPVEASMETTLLGKCLEEVPVYFSKQAMAADHSICINRVKPHTKFKGKHESGLIKMMTVGMGKHDGALSFHRWGLKYGFYKVLREMVQTIMQRCNLRYAIATVENAYEKVMCIEAIPKKQIVKREAQLLEKAKTNLATLPVKELDVLVVRQVGKEIAGPGMDTNVVGRAYDLKEDDSSSVLKVGRVAILDLSDKTAGNGAGIGNADVITERVFKKLDYEKTVMNCLTGCSLRKAFIPVRFPNDQKAIQACFTTLGPIKADEVRAVIIQDTLHLTEYWISEALVDELKADDSIKVVKKDNLEFDQENNLIFSFLTEND